MAKGPKALNPADKARKEARKKEIKKNKKQRQQVRSAVIESKDPDKILQDLENLDKLVYDIDHIHDPDRQPGGSTEILFKEKRKRLKDLWAKVLIYYQKEDPEKFNSLKKLESQYEANHSRIEREFEAIKAAQEATIDDVILPPEPDLPADLDQHIPDDDPLMSESVYITPLSDGTLKPPGCPPGPPPDFQQLVECLRSSLVVPPNLIAQTIPKNLLQLKAAKSGPRYQNRSNVRPDGGRIHPRSNKKREENIAARDEQKPKSTNETNKLAGNNEGQSRSAIIESKPVIFLQKATRFVPAAVRSKINK